MTLKRYLSILLLTVYTMFVGLPAYAALACHCVRMSEEHAQSCYHHGRPAGHPLHTSDFTAPCCDDDHQSEVVLYIPSGDDNSCCKFQSAGEAVCSTAAALRVLLSGREWFFGEPVPLFTGVSVRASGLRGPPEM